MQDILAIPMIVDNILTGIFKKSVRIKKYIILTSASDGNFKIKNNFFHDLI